MRNQELDGRRETAGAIVVGGGVIGLAIARELAHRGLEDVMVIERARLGAESSFAAGGMLAPQAEADCPNPFFELACASRDLYPGFAEALREETGIDVELESTGTLYLAFTEEDEAELEGRYRWQTSGGWPVEKMSGDEARRIEPFISPDARAALRFPLDVQVENRRLVAALATAAERLQVRLVTATSVDSVRIRHGRVEGVDTSRGVVLAPVVIVAAGAWSSFVGVRPDSRSSPIRIEPVRGQMLCFEACPRPAGHVLYSPRGYIVPRLDGRLLAGSTTEEVGFDKRVTCGGISTITTNALQIAPGMGKLTLLDTWAGLRPRAPDELPVIGASAESSGLFYATGHYRNGILLAPMTAQLIGDAVMGGAASHLAAAFSPDRSSYAAIG